MIDFSPSTWRLIATTAQAIANELERSAGDEYVTLDEALRITGRTYGSLRNLVRSGMVRTRETGPRKHEYLRGDLCRYRKEPGAGTGNGSLPGIESKKVSPQTQGRVS